MSTPNPAYVETADWCAVDEDRGIAICGTDMEEYDRRSIGLRWCFKCRRRVDFERICMRPIGPSYYGPSAHIECTNCKALDGDLFPGWTREWSED